MRGQGDGVSWGLLRFGVGVDVGAAVGMELGAGPAPEGWGEEQGRISEEIAFEVCGAGGRSGAFGHKRSLGVIALFVQ